MLISIIVPIYNVESYLEKCINALINQTYANIEIILVDDESPDHCPEICDYYQKIDSRIKVIHKKNGGLSDARNAGMVVATGQYIMFVDSDDYIELDACERFAQYAEKEYDVLVGDAIVEGGHANVEHILPSDVIYSGEEYLLNAMQSKKAPMAAWLNVYRRDFLKKNELEFKYGRLHEDEEFTPRVLLKAESILCTGIGFYHYIIRDGSITTKKDKRKNAESLFLTCLELREHYREISNPKLKKYLFDSLTTKYLGMIQSGNLIQYGKQYCHKWFLLKNAKLLKTKMRVIFFAISPRIYCQFWNRRTNMKK